MIPFDLTSIVRRRGYVRQNGTAPRTHNIPGALVARSSPGNIGSSDGISANRAHYAIQQDVSVVAPDHAKICVSGVSLQVLVNLVLMGL
jgi:hypothetical protein